MTSPDFAPQAESPDALQMQSLVDRARQLLPPMTYDVVDPDAILMQIDPTLVREDDPVEPFVHGFASVSYTVPDGAVTVSEHSNTDGPNELVIHHTIAEHDEVTGHIFLRTKKYNIDTDLLSGLYHEKYELDEHLTAQQSPLTLYDALQPERKHNVLATAIFKATYEDSSFGKDRFEEAMRLLG